MTTTNFILVSFVLFVFLGLLFLPKIIAYRGSRSRIDTELPEIEGISDRLDPSRPGLIYFFSPHCGPCKSMRPYVEKIRDSGGNVVCVNVSARYDVARQLGVLGTPTVMWIEGGWIRKVVLGKQRFSTMKKWLDQPKATVSIRTTE